jgi:hypothetical protein
MRPDCSSQRPRNGLDSTAFYHYGAVGGLLISGMVRIRHGENINVERREIKVFDCCGHCGAAFHGFFDC